ncbi:hypothetical protein J1N35_011995 [Gossypium stocksii]|uniref:Reverse transcriptase domain-containing protein n=1 Tax=Gossypium stocksii TaxID=47602 RepID=A0A9D3W4Q0_9ROSI|nr:hypothetical protein J1N35_011995 [Gossypium stocksii]
MRSLHNIQKALDHSDSSHLAQKEIDIHDELENMLNHEELLWRQKKVIHSMRCKHNRRNWMAIKLDLEKAYDRVSWGFIGVSLVAVAILEFLRKVTMSAISSFSM